MKRKWFTIVGIMFGMAICISGCGKKAQKTIGKAVAEEKRTISPKIDTEPEMEEDIPEIHYDFENSEVENLGLKEGAAAELVNGACCVKDENGEGILRLTGGSNSRTSPYLAIPAGTFDNVSELTLSEQVRIDGTGDNYYIFMLGSSNVRHFAVSLDGNSITTSFCVADGTEEKSETVEFSEDRIGEWLHVTVTIRNNSNDYIAETYVDNRMVSSFPFDGYALVDVGKGQKCSVGRPILGSSYMDGAVADLRVWFHAMGLEEIEKLVPETIYAGKE